ncbi:hypothetical protein BH11ARM2_BH11ARM2_23060 [soil metagenome]
MAIKGMHPILNTSDLPALLAYLREKAGFEVAWTVDAEGGEPVYAGLTCEGHELHAQPAESTPKGMQLYFEVDDADDAYQALKEKGAEPSEPENQSYHMRDFSVTGPEGTIIGFGAQIPE